MEGMFDCCFVSGCHKVMPLVRKDVNIPWLQVDKYHAVPKHIDVIQGTELGLGKRGGVILTQSCNDLILLSNFSYA